MAHDIRAAEAMRKFSRALNEIQALGLVGFAHLLDTASAEEMDDLLAAADVVLEQVERARRSG